MFSEGTVIGECQPRHRHQEFVCFLDRIEESVESGLDIHLVLDNYGTHKHPAVNTWLVQRPRTFHSVRDLIKAINDDIKLFNKKPQLFLWIASASQIIRKVNKYKDTSDTGD